MEGLKKEFPTIMEENDPGKEVSVPAEEEEFVTALPSDMEKKILSDRARSSNGGQGSHIPVQICVINLLFFPHQPYSFHINPGNHSTSPILSGAEEERRGYSDRVIRRSMNRKTNKRAAISRAKTNRKRQEEIPLRCSFVW